MQGITRTRWAAIGAAVAVTLGAGGISLSQAAVTTSDTPVIIALDAPCRVIDARGGDPIGPGDANDLTVQITGTNGDCTGPIAIPTDAVGVATNVTVIPGSHTNSLVCRSFGGDSTGSRNHLSLVFQPG